MAYFEQLGHPIPPFTNPSDHWLRLLTVKDEDGDDRARVDTIIHQWTKNRDDPQWADQSLKRTISHNSEDRARQALSVFIPHRTSQWTQFKALGG